MDEDQIIRELEERVAQLELLAARVPPRPAGTCGPGLQICAFTLNEELTQGGSAEAWFVEYTEDVTQSNWLKTDEPLTVWDPLDTFRGQAFTRGFAFKGLSWDRWNVLQMGCDANQDDAAAAGAI